MVMDFQQVSKGFFRAPDLKEVDQNNLAELRNFLKSVQVGDLKTIEDHRAFIYLLSKFRESIAKTASLNGENFNATLASLLAVGADGLYHNDLRFLFELIQNVDDCSYDDLSQCELSIHFDTNYGTITLEYNECGFRPFDVFAITGIAEAAKNISPDRVEIGEKGIGFKSVFGVADKVLVQSGLFSFMLYENNFTVPYEQYHEFSGVRGTRLTLYLKTTLSSSLSDDDLARDRGRICRSIYEKLVSEYGNKQSLFNKNPILFLNKLTKIRLYTDSLDSMEFTVSKGLEKIEVTSGLSREDGVIISSVISSRGRNMENQKASISCTRYTSPIRYDRDMCVSRYGEKTSFAEKGMMLQIVIPDPECVAAVGTGALYSFLPTQVKIAVPMSCHIPFKLDSSREYVDSQGKNKWFCHSMDAFASMLHKVYGDYAKHVQKSILTYVPKFNEDYFAIEAGNDKLLSLKSNDLLGNNFLREPILYTEEKHYRSCSDVFCFSSAEEIKDPIALYSLLGYHKELFVSNSKQSVSAYGIDVLKDAHFELLFRALGGKISLGESLDVIDEAGVSYNELIGRLDKKLIPCNILNELSNHPKCFKAINDLSIEKIKSNAPVLFEITDATNIKDVRFIIAEEEPIDASFFDEQVARYLANRKFSYIAVPLRKDQKYLAAKNLLVLNAEDELDALAQFCRDVNKNDRFSATLRMRAASNSLNKIDNDNSITTSEYMKLLREVRNNIKMAFGVKHYESYIRVIRELNSDPQRFIRELLQNADDCKYADGVTPSFQMHVDGNRLITEYNEVGFTKENVRAITAIGESTKKQIHSGNFEIGEKGIGFKTVFAVADAVDIHSKDFHFRLTANTPTIPSIISAISGDVDGTQMVFELRERMSVSFAPEQILALCLCLRNLKDITINGIKVRIEDAGSKRLISVDNLQYVFDVYKHHFLIEDPQLLAERNNGGKNVDRNQEILFYISEKSVPKLKYYLYSGLPTAIELGVPCAIDAPFELTASRDHILQNKWNERQRHEMYKAYASMLECVAHKQRIKVLQYVRFQNLQFGSIIKFSLFKNEEDSWLKEYNAISLLEQTRFIPTYDPHYFAKLTENIYRYPAIVHAMISRNNISTASQREIIDDPSNTYDGTLKNLRCKSLSPMDVARHIVSKAHLFIEDDKFRAALYKYLSETSEMHSLSHLLVEAQIIPVKSKRAGEKIRYIAYKGNDLFVDDSATLSPPDYDVIDTSVLSRKQLTHFLDVDIRVMDDGYKRLLYTEKIANIINSPKTNAEKYRLLVAELVKNREQFIMAQGTLLQYRESVPLLMENGGYRCGGAFVAMVERGYFCGPLLCSRIVSKEAAELAKLIRCPDISVIMYDDLEIDTDLTADDIEDLRSGYVRRGYYILEQCMVDGLISDELIQRYGLEGVKRTDYGEYFDEDDFPNEPIKNIVNLRSKLATLCLVARKIVKVQEPRTVDKVQLPSGKQQLLDSAEIREDTMKRYRPTMNTDGCFCQMCRAVKSTEYIEVNNILVKPEYYWPQMRVALCLDCSKRFKLMRGNPDIIKTFYKNIRHADLQSASAIKVPIGNADIRFTQTHLAEIQEILKSNKI